MIHSESRLFYLFTHLHLLSSDSFSSLIFSPLIFSLLFSSLPFPFSSLPFLFSSSSLPFPSLLFSSLTLPTSAFPSLHTVGSLTSKLPSLISIIMNFCSHFMIPRIHTCGCVPFLGWPRETVTSASSHCKHINFRSISHILSFSCTFSDSQPRTHSNKAYFDIFCAGNNVLSDN